MGYLPSLNRLVCSSNPRNVQYVLIENRQTQYIRLWITIWGTYKWNTRVCYIWVRIYLYIYVLLFISTNKSLQCNIHLLLISIYSRTWLRSQVTNFNPLGSTLLQSTPILHTIPKILKINYETSCFVTPFHNTTVCCR
jgi:hypothetical protein